MDRYLFTGALGLLIFQVLYLLADLGLLGSYNLHTKVERDQSPIGRLIQKRQAVKRKALNSLIWEEPEKNEQLYRYDSVLTLENSGAELELDGDIKLNVHENTLVVLEPMQKESRDNFRVRFQKGLLRARSKNQRLSIGSGDWVLEANEGSNLSIRSLSGEKLEVEVNKGSVQLQNRETSEVKDYAQGQKLTLAAEEILKQESLDESLVFTEPKVNRIYTHNFPMPIEVRWEGPAETLQVLSPNSDADEINLANKDSELLFLNPGTYLLTLKKDNFISPSFTLELKPAPKLKYLHPLPRDRMDIGKSNLFSWFQQLGIQDYEILIEKDGSKAWSKSSPSAYADIKPPLNGRYEWSVEAKDSEGYRIPPFYSIPVYFTDSPLAAPKLNAPKKRVPATEQKIKDGAWLDRIWSLILPKAHADEFKVEREVIFTWYPVSGADFYIIEISDAEDFLKPLVIKKINTEEFSWKGFSEQKYYWRVAAGQEGGRMGLFSEASEFDVTKLKALKASDFAPGVRYVETPKPTPTPMPAPTPTPVPAPKVVKPSAPKVAPPTKYSLAVQADYLNIDQENTDLNQAQFKGLATLSLSGSKTWWISENVWVTDFDFKMLGWEPKEPAKLPFQSDISTFFAKLKAYREEANWGASLMHMPLAERADLEEVEINSVLAFGFFYGLDVAMDQDMSWRTSFDIHYGDGIGFGGWNNEFRYILKSDGKKTQHFGAHFDLGFGAGGDNTTSTSTSVGASYGWSW